MPFPRRKSLKKLHFWLFLAAALLGSLAVTGNAQQQPASAQTQDINKDTNGGKEDQQKSEAPSVPDSAQPRPHETNSSLQLGVGDLVELTVYDVPELTNKTRISSTGDIYCALIGPTHVAGLTTEQAAGVIQ
jgi:polysaccharide export outer membrane protein